VPFNDLTYESVSWPSAGKEAGSERIRRSRDFID